MVRKSPDKQWNRPSSILFHETIPLMLGQNWTYGNFQSPWTPNWKCKRYSVIMLAYFLHLGLIKLLTQ
jgi:hypothetical protein